tara:strand:- start:8723 stop:8935 length:213 start_codon:yes stop_codon:yes gene_type:complete
MGMVLLNKVLLIVLILAISNIIRHGFLLVQTWMNNTVENRERYTISYRQLLWVGLSIAYIVTSIISGVYI